MPRIQQRPGVKGSQKWIQTLVNEKLYLLSSLIRTQLNLPDTATITWHSPIAEDGYAEYQDQAFLDLLGIKLPKYPFLISGLREGQSGMGWGDLKPERYSWLKPNLTSLKCCHQKQERG